MKRYLNTLYITTNGTSLHKTRETIKIRLERQTKLQIPILSIGQIVCIGRVFVTPELMAFCAKSGVTISFLSPHGKFLARVEGPRSGNVLLRKNQFRHSENLSKSAGLAKIFTAAKVANSKNILNRHLRNHPGENLEMTMAIDRLTASLSTLKTSNTLDEVRGIEGEASKIYFGRMNDLIMNQKVDFFFNGRSRRPPLDRMNALLSFIYMLLVNDVRSALEGVGLDPQIGFLHRDRPGRPSLALDMMEEFRAYLGDRLALSLVNLGSVQGSDFVRTVSGAFLLKDKPRKDLLIAYQKRKQEEITHPFLDEKTTIGLLPHLQAMLLARTLRGDLETYPPFVVK